MNATLQYYESKKCVKEKHVMERSSSVDRLSFEKILNFERQRQGIESVTSLLLELASSSC